MNAQRRPRIVDFSTHLSGPFASQLLAQLDADVIKVESPRGGDGNRALGPVIEGQGLLHVALNPGVRSVAIDSRSPEWPIVVAGCARWADAVIVGARPSAARARGIDFESIARLNSRIIFCSISGYGDSGPWQDRPAHGQNVDALAGLVDVEWIDDGPTSSQGFRSAGPVLAGVYAALGLMTALYRREVGHPGPQYVAVSLWHAAMSWQWRDHIALANLGKPWPAYSELGSRYAMYATSDHRAVLVCPIERDAWREFCRLCGLEDLADRGDWTDGVDYGQQDESSEERVRISAALAMHTVDEWTRRFEGSRVPYTPVLTAREALDSGHAQETHVLRPTTMNGRPVMTFNSPVRIGDQAQGSSPLFTKEPRHTTPPPVIGEHTREVLSELGLGHLAIDL